MRVLAVGGKPISVDGKLVSPPASTGITTQEKSVTLTKNGSYEVSRDSDKYISKVAITVAVPSDAKEEQTKSITCTSNGLYKVISDSGKVMTSVDVMVALPTEQWTFTLEDGSSVQKTVVTESTEVLS